MMMKSNAKSITLIAGVVVTLFLTACELRKAELSPEARIASRPTVTTAEDLEMSYLDNKLPDIRASHINVCRYGGSSHSEWTMTSIIRNCGGNKGIEDDDGMWATIIISYRDEYLHGRGPSSQTREIWVKVPVAGEISIVYAQFDLYENSQSLSFDGGARYVPFDDAYHEIPKAFVVHADFHLRSLAPYHVAEENEHNNAVEIIIPYTTFNDLKLPNGGNARCWATNSFRPSSDCPNY